MQEGVREEAQRAADPVGGGQARAAGAPGFDGVAFGPEGVEVLAQTLALEDDIQGAPQGHGALETRRGLGVGSSSVSPCLPLSASQA